MVELSSYGCKFTCSDGTWAVNGAVARVARDAPASDPTPEPHTWSHEDILIAKPRKATTLPPGVSAHTILFILTEATRSRLVQVASYSGAKMGLV